MSTCKLDIKAVGAAKTYSQLSSENQRIAARMIDLLLDDAAFPAAFRRVTTFRGPLSAAELSAFMNRWIEKKKER